jgi:hypothetical protein
MGRTDSCVQPEPDDTPHGAWRDLAQRRQLLAAAPECDRATRTSSRSSLPSLTLPIPA